MGRIWKLSRAVRAVVCVGLAASLWACGDGNPTSDANANNGTNNGTNNGENNGENNGANNGMNNGDPGCEAFSASLTVDQPVSVTFENEGSAVAGLGIEVPLGVVPEDVPIELSCAQDSLVPDGFTPLGPIITVSALPGVRPEKYRLTLPFDAAAFPEGALPSAVRVFVRFPNGDVRSPAFPDIQEDLNNGRVRFESHIFGEFQVAVPSDAGEMVDRRFVYRAITGISMGSGGAAMIGYRNAEEFDVIGALGGAADWEYLIHYIREGGMGGFCTDANPDDPSTWSCDTFQVTQEFEHAMRYDEWFFSTGSGTGGTFDRESYQEIFKDLAYAFGNMAYYNPDHPYLPPGITPEEWHRPYDEVCPAGGIVIEEGYYDDEYNPDGSLPVISFCDGTGDNDRMREFDRACDIDPEDGINDEPNKGLYPGPEGQRRAMEIALAVDYNGNGMRDFGEPVIRNFWEPWNDFGADGTASKDEEGYDPVTNPDPAGDDYHYAYNPFGSEGNWRYEDGEPYEDVGLDGLPDTPQVAEGGYDWGQGNGRFDANPNVINLWDRNSRGTLAGLDKDARDDVLHHTTLYADGGIRDLFNFAVSTNQLAGAVQGHGGNVRIYDDFTELALADAYTSIDVTQIDYTGLGEHVVVRYGDPDADAEKICLGDGKHVGETFQTINRLLIMLGFITNRLPGGDTTTLDPPYALASGDYFVESPGVGGKFKYSIAYPPGYEYTQCNDGLDNDGDGMADGDDSECFAGDHNNEAGPESLSRCEDGIDNDLDGDTDGDDAECDGDDDDAESLFFEDKEFPVVYILHGYGQSPEDLKPSLLVLTGYMGGGFWPKAILVFPDGFCGETKVTQCNDGVDNDGDGMVDRDDDGCDESNAEGGVDLPACADGVDNDQDGAIDTGDDHGCVNDADNDEANCVQGTFYTDHAVYPDGTTPGPSYEGAVMDLVRHVDDNYQTKKPEIIQVPR